MHKTHAVVKIPQWRKLNPELAIGMKSPESNYALAWKLAKDHEECLSSSIMLRLWRRLKFSVFFVCNYLWLKSVSEKSGGDILKWGAFDTNHFLTNFIRVFDDCFCLGGLLHTKKKAPKLSNVLWNKLVFYELDNNSCLVIFSCMMSSD